MIRTIFFLTVSISLSTQASSMLIKRVNAKKNKVIAELPHSSKIKKGHFITATDNCTLEVNKVRDNKVLLIADMCTDKSILKNNSKVLFKIQ